MMSGTPAMMWVVSLMFVLLVTCLHDAQAAFGIPDFLEMGKCVKVPLKKDFDPVKYSGLWFDIESVPNEYQHTKKCVTQNYTWSGTHMNVATRGLTSENKKVRQGAIMRVETETVSEPNPAHMTVDAAGVPAAPYQIVSTDYRTYACVYSCLEYFGFRAEFFWIFGRTPTLPAEKIKLCHSTFENLGIDYKKMVPIIQGQPCPYSDKLPQMLQESEAQLLKILGPYVPTSSAPIPVTSTVKSSPQAAIDEELKEIKKIVQEEKNIIQELEKKVGPSAEETIPKEEKVPKIPVDEDLNSSTSSTPAAILLLLPLLLTVVFHH